VKEGPHWLYMHGGGCLACHGERGEGGIYPHMCSVISPAITYKSLTSHDREHESRNRKEHEHEEVYKLEDIRRALETGQEPEGDFLNPCMPRWKLTDQDFRDLIAYLLFLDS